MPTLPRTLTPGEGRRLLQSSVVKGFAWCGQSSPSSPDRLLGPFSKEASGGSTRKGNVGASGVVPNGGLLALSPHV
jgi:hypothetical protein